MTSEALINHLNNHTNCCHPMSGRYCAVGRELWLQYRAECVRDGGKEAMLCVRAQSPEWAEEIKSRALILINGESRKAA